MFTFPLKDPAIYPGRSVKGKVRARTYSPGDSTWERTSHTKQPQVSGCHHLPQRQKKDGMVPGQAAVSRWRAS
jgi:hypothetical protein